MNYSLRETTSQVRPLARRIVRDETCDGIPGKGHNVFGNVQTNFKLVLALHWDQVMCLYKWLTGLS
jgi:hypothetical protein